MKYIINIDYYNADNYYSHTETVEYGHCEQPVTAESYWEAVADDYPMTDGKWLTVRVEIYADDADPMIDEPISSSEYTPELV